MTFDPPPGQGPIDPRGAFQPPPPPGNIPPQRPPGMMPPPQMPPMPPGMMPPGMMPPYPPPMYMPPPRRSGGFVRGVFLTLATTIFGLSLLLNVYLLIFAGLLGGGQRAHSTNVLEGDPKQKVAVIPINGVIMEEMSAKIDRWLRTIESDGNVKALVLEIDSPGGSVTASDEIWHRVRQFKKDNPKIPIVVAMNGLAASGGYYVACAGDYLFAQPSTLTGNIGVLLPQFNIARLMDEWGIEENTIISQGATFKNAGSMFQPESPEHRAYLQDIADKAFAQFKDVVATGRQSKLQKPMTEIANGKVFMADDALALGLIDQIGYPKEAYEYAAKQAGLNNMTVVKYRDPPTIFEALASNSRIAAPQSQSVTINGVNINADDLRELLTPRLMYLWRGQ